MATVTIPTGSTPTTVLAYKDKRLRGWALFQNRSGTTIWFRIGDDDETALNSSNGLILADGEDLFISNDGFTNPARGPVQMAQASGSSVSILLEEGT